MRKNASVAVQPFSGVTNPCLIRKSKATGTLVVLKSAQKSFSRHCSAGSNSKVSTSPSAFSGIKSNGSSKSNTNSVLGNNPRSDSKKNLRNPMSINHCLLATNHLRNAAGADQVLHQLGGYRRLLHRLLVGGLENSVTH
jgi:hypothetical protein